MTNKRLKPKEKEQEVLLDKPRKTTLGELGCSLPIFMGGEKDCKERTFSFREWDMEIEEELSDLQEKSANTGEFVRKMLILLLDEFSGVPWEGKTEEEKILLISQMDYPNILYMYFALRVEELGHDLVFDSLTCPSCKKVIKDWVADLRTLEVDCKDKGHALTTDYELKKPIRLNAEKMITGLRLGVTKWGVMEKIPLEKATNSAYVKKTMFLSALQACLNNGKVIKGFTDPKEVIKKLKKSDIEHLAKAVVKHNCGPDMLIGGNCPHCKAEFVKVLEWSYDRFFESSSL